MYDLLEVPHPRIRIDEERLWDQMCTYLEMYGPLSVWAPSSHADDQHLVLINSRHPAYSEVLVKNRRLI